MRYAPAGDCSWIVPAGEYVVGGDAIAEHRDHPRLLDLRNLRRALARHLSEKGRAAHVGGVGVPPIDVPRGRLERAPLLVAGENLVVILAIELRTGRLAHSPLDLVLVGQRSRRKTGLPCGSCASGSLSRSIVMRPQAQRPRRAAATSGNWRALPSECAPRSCGFPTVRPRPRASCGLSPRRSPAEAARNCRCRWCSRSRRG